MRRSLLAFAFALLLASPGHAAEAAPVKAQDYGSDWLTVLSKTLTFELASSTTETALFLAFYGWYAGTAGAVLAVTMAGSMSVYLAHEVAWEAYLDADTDRAAPALVAMRATTYRLASIARSFVTGRVLGNDDVTISATFAVSAAAVDTGIFVVHDMLFVRLRSAFVRH